MLTIGYSDEEQVREVVEQHKPDLLVSDER